MLTSTRTPLLPQRRGNTMPNETLHTLRPMSLACPQVGTVNNDPIPIPPERRTVHDSESISHPKKNDELCVQPTTCQSNSSSMRNESTPSSTRTRKSGRITHRRNTTDSSMHSSSEVTEASFGNECNFVGKVGLDHVSVVDSKKALDLAMSVVGSMMEASDDDKLWMLLAMQMPFVCVVSLSSAPYWCVRVHRLIVVCLASWKSHRTWPMYICIPCNQPNHRTDGCSEAD